MTTPDSLLELQLNDSAMDQLRQRMPRLPEVVASNAANAEVTGWEQRSAELARQSAELETAITTIEGENATVTKHRTRLEAQLKTVISPREAEALMHEIALLNGKRSDFDDAELEALEGLAETESAAATHAENEARIRAAAVAAAVTADAARAISEAELAERATATESMRAALDPAVLRQYDSMRAAHNGVAVAKLNGLRCEGCHLDLSRGEVDDIKRMPPEALPECPNCGRLLVR